ncbi:heavy metal translocating P-type ATPase [Tabrizicola flagellatus]|uniref:heavy metal translocating P-type ATPase n=1 Tax=Tabrizicola flagellatus TaxID=2593021 RepID=UPI001F1ACBFF|nr:cation-translocating P-type ATPase [Tabrizicola flagellatus]
MPEQIHDTDEDSGLYLTILCWIGLALGTLDAFVQPLPAGLVWAALGLAYLTGGLPPLRSAVSELWHERRLDIDLLMVVAALAAAAVGAALEGAVLLALFSLSETLEHRAMGKARRAVEALMRLRPETALREGPEGVVEVAVADLVPGDRVILRPGARVPVDGRIVAGSGHLDESTVTGEAEPVRKGLGDPVHEATVNLDGILTAEVTRGLEESTVAQMIRMVTEAQAMKSPSERFSDWFGQRYTIAVLAGSVLSWFGFRAVGHDPGEALYRAATLLVAASPCAVVISVPAAILSALSAAARGGVLFKGGAALEGLAEVRTFAFDKTGTLTTGQAAVTQIVALEGDEDTFLALAAGLEAQSEHPIAGAIRHAASERGLVPKSVRDVRSLPSEGITGTDDSGPLWAGNARMLAQMGAELPPGIAALADGAETLVILGRGTRILGALTVADEPRATSGEALAALKAGGGTAILMMTGDRAPVAARIGSHLGLAADEIHAGLLPGDKVRLVDTAAKRGKVAFIGDGVNDAAALARADVGVAMGVAGSEVALQAADVALMAEDLRKLAAARRLSRRTARVIRQNLTLALGAMAVLVTGSLFFELPLPLAVLGHEGGTLLVVLNGLRLLADPIRARG